MSLLKSNKNKADTPKKKYRIFIRNDETLQQIFSLKLNFKAIYVLFTSVLLIFFVISWLLIAYTPLKRFTPGYDDVFIHPEYMKLSKKVTELEKQFDDQAFYIQSFRSLLLGEAADSILEQNNLPGFSALSFDEVPKVDSAEKSIIRLEGQAKSEEEEKQSFIPIKKDKSADVLSSIGQLYLIPPVKGVVIQAFDPVKRHYGVDLSAPKNSAVKAVLDGYVLSSDWTLETGNTVSILHDNNIVSFYKHNAANLVNVGSYVKAGEAVAIIGNTGEKSSGPHLHFELWINGAPVNPLEYINF